MPGKYSEFTLKHFRDLILLLLGGAFLYINVLSGPFVFDDHVFIVNHPQVVKGGSLLSYFSKGFCEGAKSDCPYYRPLVTLFHRLDFMIWGENPFGFHLSSLMVHLVVLTLLYFVVMIIFKNRTTALVASLLFAVHPIHVESVAVISNRTDPPTAVFFLLSVLGFHLYFKKNRKPFLYFTLSLASFGFAVFTKEIGLTIPVLLLAYDFLFARPWSGFRNLLLRWPTYLPFAVVGLIYLWVRSNAVGESALENVYGFSLWERFLNMVVLIQQYLLLLVIPYPLVIFHEMVRVSGVWEPEFIFSLILLVVVFGVIILRRKDHPEFLFSGLWFLVTLFPVLGLIPFPSPALMERSAYIPSIGFCLGVGFLASHMVLQKWFKNRIWVRKGIQGVFGSILVLFSVMTIDRNRVWLDEVVLWEDLFHKLSPEFPMGHFNLGQEYHLRGDLEKAEIEYLRAIQHNPHPIIYKNLGMIYQKQGKSDKAIEFYQRAIDQGINDPKVHFNLGIELLNRGKIPEAVSFFREAIRLDKNYAKPYLQLAAIYTDLGNHERAVDAYREALRINPGDSNTRFNFARLLDQLGSDEEAGRHYRLFLRQADPKTVSRKLMREAEKRLNEIQSNGSLD